MFLGVEEVQIGRLFYACVCVCMCMFNYFGGNFESPLLRPGPTLVLDTTARKFKKILVTM